VSVHLCCLSETLRDGVVVAVSERLISYKGEIAKQLTELSLLHLSRDEISSQCHINTAHYENRDSMSFEENAHTLVG